MRVPVPIRGPFSLPLRLFGIKISRMNPNLCTICESMFTRVKKSKQVPIQATVLFADVRGYTTLSEDAVAADIAEMLHGFYDDCAEAIWERDGIVNKFIGDAVLAIFNFPITQSDHARQAVLAAMDIQKRCSQKMKLQNPDGSGKNLSLGIGIGIHSGEASIGEVGTAYKDFTIIGSVVNTASRLQSAANAKEVLVTNDVYQQVSDLFPDCESRAYALKGLEKPVTAYSLS